MYEKRRKTLPANPKSISEVHQALNVLNIETKQKENFLLLNNEKENIIIFSCSTNLKFLTSVDTVYMDGTFDYYTRFFMQMFTIHGFQNGHYVPLIFCLLPNKLTSTYIFALRSIYEKCKDMNLIFSPANVTIDYEKAIINAVTEVWPESNIIGCRFHLTNSWWKKIQSLGLSMEYKEKIPKSANGYDTHFGLLFLDAQEVSDCFSYDFMSDRPVNELLTKYSDYLVDNYIGDDCSYPPSLWSSLSASLTRTTNACESFHAVFKDHFYKRTPHIIPWITVLIENIQTNVYITLKSINECKTLRKI